MWALRNEVLRIAAPELLPEDESQQLRLEDLLGFRRNPTNSDAALPRVPRQGPRRAPHAGHALRPPLHRGLGRRPGFVPRSGARGPRHLRRRRAARARRRGRGGPDAGARRRGARLRRHRRPRQRRRARRLEPVLDRLGPRHPRGRDSRRLRAVDADGALPPSRLERRRGAGRDALGQHRPRAAAGARARQRPAHRHRLPHQEGLRVRHRGARRRTAPVTSCAPPGSSRRSSRSCAKARWRCRPASRGPRAAREAATRRSSRSASGRRSSSSGASSRPTSPSPRPSPSACVASRERLDRRQRDAPEGCAIGREGLRRGSPAPRCRPSSSFRPAARPRCADSSAGCSATSTGLGGRVFRCRGGPPRLDERQRGGPGVSGRVLPRQSEPGGAPAGRGRHLRGRHGRRAVRALVVRQAHRRGLVVRRIPRAARTHRRTAPRHRRSGTRVRHRRALPPDDPRLRSRRPQDRRGRPDPRRSPAAAAPPGELSAAHDGHAHALGTAGDLPARGGSAREPAGRHRPVRHPADGEGARPRRPWASHRPPRLRRASTSSVLPEACHRASSSCRSPP